MFLEAFNFTVLIVTKKILKEKEEEKKKKEVEALLPRDCQLTDCVARRDGLPGESIKISF